MSEEQLTIDELANRTGVAALSRADASWRELARRKLTELDQRLAHAQAARTLIAHAVACQHQDIRECPNGASVRAARLAGASLEQAHQH